MYESLFVMLLLLIFGHFIADYIFQTEFIAKNKCPNGEGIIPWPYVMTAHVSGHALAVYLVTGSMFLGILEFIAHFIIDWCKCTGKIDIHQDQFAHVLCKVLWCAIIAFWVTNV